MSLSYFVSMFRTFISFWANLSVMNCNKLPNSWILWYWYASSGLCSKKKQISCIQVYGALLGYSRAAFQINGIRDIGLLHSILGFGGNFNEGISITATLYFDALIFWVIFQEKTTTIICWFFRGEKICCISLSDVTVNQISLAFFRLQLQKKNPSKSRDPGLGGNLRENFQLPHPSLSWKDVKPY